MSRRRRASIALVVGSLFGLSGMLPAARAGTAGSDPRTLPRTSRPAPLTPVVVAKATRHGIRVAWHHAPANAATFTVKRSNGTTVTDLTPKGVHGDSFIDHSAQSGTSYSYTVTIASTRTANSTTSKVKTSGRLAGKLVGHTGDTVGTASAEMTRKADAKTKPHAVKAHAVHKRAAHTRSPATSSHHPHRAAQAFAAHTMKAHLPDPSCQFSDAGNALPTGQTTWSPASCANGYEVTGDLTIPAGSQLILSPGTEVYVDTTADSGGAGDPSSAVDIIVRGALTTAGGDKPATITSINAAPPGSGILPAAEDWGYLFFDGTQGNTPTGSALTDVVVSYGTALVADHFALPLSGVTISHMAGDSESDGLDYQNVPTGASISIDGLNYDGTETSTGVGVYSGTDTFSGTLPLGSATDVPADGFAASVTNSSITGYYPLWIEDDSPTNPAVNATVTGDKLTEISDGYELDLEAHQADPASWDASSSVGTAAVTGTVTGNTLSGGSSSYGAYIYAAATNTDASTSGSCTGACNTVSMGTNGITSNETALDSEADVASGSGNAVVSNGAASSGGSILSEDSDAIDTAAYNRGTGDASSNPSFSGVVINGYDDGLDNYVDAVAGNATGNPTLTGSSITSQWEYGIDSEVYGSDSSEQVAGGATGTATGSPTVTNTPVTAYDQALYNDVESGGGTSTASPQFSGSKLTSADDDTVDNWSYADEYQNGSGQYDNGTAVASPSFSGGALTSSYDYGLDNYAESEGGAATASPSLASSPVSAIDDTGIDNESYADWSSYTGGDQATADPQLSGSPVTAYYDTLYNEAESEAGASEATPSLNGSGLTSVEDYGVENYSYADYNNTGNGSATGSPSLTNSPVQSYYATLYNDVESYGGASTASPAFASSALTTNDDDAVDNYSYSDWEGGTGDPAVGSPSFTASPVSAYEDGLYNDVEADSGGDATGNPTFSGSAIISTYDRGIYNDVESYGQVAAPTARPADAGASGPTATADPSLTSSPITVGGDGDEGIYNNAQSGYGPATANPLLVTSGVTAGDDDGIDNYATSAYDGGTGPAVAQPSLTGSPVNAAYEGVYTEAYADSGDGSADASPTLAQSPITTQWDQGLEADAYGAGSGASTVNPAISGSDITAPDDDGIDIYAEPEGSGAANIGGTVSDTTVKAYDDATSFEAYGGGSAASGITTALTNVNLQSADDDGMDASGYNYGSAVTVDPTFTGGSITAPEDNSIDLDAEGYGSAATDVIEAAPVVSGTPSTSYYGPSIYADGYDGSWAGNVHAGGSLTNSPVQSMDGEGLYSEADCWTCTGQAVVDTALSDSTVSAYDNAVDVEAYANDPAEAIDNASVAFDSATPGTVESYDGNGIYSWDQVNGVMVITFAKPHDTGSAPTGLAQNGLKVTDAHVSGYDSDLVNETASQTADATNAPVVTSSVFDNTWSSSGTSGIADGAAAQGIATEAPSISGNTISGLQGGNSVGIGVGVNSMSGDPGSEHPQISISKNDIENIGGFGIQVFGGEASPTGQCGASPVLTCVGQSGIYAAHVTGNTIRQTGEGGIFISGVLPDVESNTQSGSGLAGDSMTTGGRDGLFIQNSTDQGLVSCNSISGNARGIEYSSNLTPAADPLTTQNAFTDPTGGNENQPYNLATDNTDTGAASNAESNFWGPYTPVSDTIQGSVDTTSPLSSVPVCAGGAAPVVSGGGGGGGASETLPPTLPPGDTVISTVSNNLPAGGSLSSSPGGPTTGTSVVANITLPGSLSGSVTISQISGPPPAPSSGGGTTTGGYSFLGQGFAITAPPSTDPTQPLKLGFSVLSSDLPAGTDPSSLVVFRDGAPVSACSSGSALPCATVAVTDGVITVNVITDHASIWNFAVPKSTRLAGTNREGTAIAISQADFAAGKAGAVVLARSDSYPDALAGSALATAKKAPVLLTSSSQLDPAVGAEISRALPAGGTVYLLGGQSALSDTVASAVQALGYNPVRLAGADRYATAVDIAQAVGTVKTVLVTTGTNFADALAAAPVTSSPGTVIVLTDGTSVPQSTLSFLYGNLAATMYAIGGPAARALPAVTPLVGGDRYATAAVVAAKFFPAPTGIGVASGTNFPDALAAGSHLARLGQPLLLTDPQSVPASLATYLGSVHGSLTRAEIYGGTAAVSSAVQQAVAAAIG